MDKFVVLNHFNGDFSRFYKRFLPGLKQVGMEYKAICPFHDDKTPSLSINPENGRFNCFGCNSKGNIFSFYSKLKNINGDFQAVLACIAADFGIFDNGTPQLEKVSGAIVEVNGTISVE